MHLLSYVNEETSTPRVTCEIKLGLLGEGADREASESMLPHPLTNQRVSLGSDVAAGEGFPGEGSTLSPEGIPVGQESTHGVTQ